MKLYLKPEVKKKNLGKKKIFFFSSGSMAYMAPEVWENSEAQSGSGFTPKSDIYSMAIVKIFIEIKKKKTEIFFSPGAVGNDLASLYREVEAALS
jgi:hypothetical protein